MAANFVVRSFTVAAGYAPLIAADDKWAGDAFTGTIEVRSGNTGNTTFKGPEGVEVVLIKGFSFPVYGVRLSEIQAKGTADDIVIMVGSI